MKELKPFSAFCIAAAGSGDGKTTVSLALMRALFRRGLTVQPFKCGPDYIDPSFHDRACRRLSRNLDSWMMGEAEVKTSFHRASADADAAVIEGVMGMFDGARPGSLDGSTARIAQLTETPVLLVVNSRGMAGSIAAMVKGYTEFCPSLRVIGVIANKVGSPGHAAILREALELAGLPPLLGYFPRNEQWIMPERHLGLVPYAENSREEAWFEQLAEAAEELCDLDRILELSRLPRPAAPVETILTTRARLAVARDEAFHFYYADNLDLLRRLGVELVEFSPLHDSTLPPEIDGVYLGGGFPEMFAAGLEANTAMRQELKAFHQSGGFIYAECGGFMYLSESLTDDAGEKRQMCGLVPGRCVMTGKLHSLGYREVESVSETVFGVAGIGWRGHEFHWSDMEFDGEFEPLWRMRNVRNPDWQLTGFRQGNLYAGYIHLHFASNPAAVEQLIENLIKARLR